MVPFHCTFSAKHNDYRRVITECSGLQSCSNIVLKHSTEIPCAGTGLHTSHYMDVDYTCVAGEINYNYYMYL